MPKGDSTAANSSNGDPVRGEEFARLLAKHQRTIYVYIHALQNGGQEVDDIYQETCVKCWEEFHQFELGTNFSGWACTVAFNQVRAFRKKRSRSKEILSEACLSAISKEMIEHEDYYAARSKALQGCIQKLPEHHRELLQQRYFAERSIESLASQLERNLDSVYRMLSRIRHSLFECVERKLKLEESS